MPKVEGVKYVLLDIDVLATEWDDASFKPYRDAFPEEYRSSPAALQAHVEGLTKRDVKVAYLKNLQGYLWEDGYKSGAYSTPLFPDVAPRLKAWKDDGVRLAIYSSGSVFAQKLLFQHVSVGDYTAAVAGQKRSPATASNTDDGNAEPAKKAARRSSRNKPTTNDAISTDQDKPDAGITSATQPTGTEDLRGLMTEDGWFDTTNAGLKAEATSYEKIVQALRWKPAETLFLTDNVKEYDAADSAKLKVLLLDRPGNAVVSDDDKARLQIVSSLEDIDLTSSKPSDGKKSVPTDEKKEES
ncbi:enolase-phosphatase E1 [Recurvomyces mirabilis]|uniref:Enolase-phosphatase E1 n=1 Tax=Recurvomyces mirabilis TaxID=574656 RepID=A0AAE0TNR7_9PEZI|nr:enolase-phosphatase E1 [Recurvomyces mirabilis]KAK5155659.1 enolase-phosphatase E1 [Recurvomyces mirabilis]